MLGSRLRPPLIVVSILALVAVSVAVAAPLVGSAAVVDHSTEAMFAITLVKIPRRHSGKLQFGVAVKTHEVALIGIPFIPICD